MEMQNKGDVIFRRVNGKVIPIKVKGGAAGAASKGGGRKAGGLPKGEKMSRGKQALVARTSGAKKTLKKRESGGNGYVTAGAAAVAGVATYALMRKFKLSKIPQLARLQTAVKESGGYSMATGAKRGSRAAKIQSAIYGAKVNPAGGDGGVIFRHTFNGRNGIRHTINPAELQEAFASKRTFGAMFGGTFAPKTMNLEDALKKVGGDHTRLKEHFGANGFIIKNDDAARSKFSDFLDEKTILQGSEKARATIKNPQRAVIQEKMQLKGEYRAHYVNGKVYGISHRYLPHKGLRGVWNKLSSKAGGDGAGGAFVPVVGKKRKEIEGFVQSAMNSRGAENLGKNGQSFHTAFDIGDTADGLKMIEGQPSMGTFTNPIINRQFHRHASGRWGRDVSAGAAIMSASATGVAASALQRKPKKKKK